MTASRNGHVKKRPWWFHFIGPALGYGALQLYRHFGPPLHDEALQLIIAVAAILIAAWLSYAIYRLARM